MASNKGTTEGTTYWIARAFDGQKLVMKLHLSSESAKLSFRRHWEARGRRVEVTKVIEPEEKG